MFNRIDDFSETFRKKCQSLGATTLSKADFMKTSQKKVSALKPDCVVWSEGDQDVLASADSVQIPVVSIKWINE